MKSQVLKDLPSVIVVASETELPRSRRIWGSETWTPTEKREALDWLTLSRLIGWNVSIVYENSTADLRNITARCIVIACNPDLLHADFAAHLTSLLEKEPSLIVSCVGAGDSPFGRLSGSVRASKQIEGRWIRWTGPGARRIWTCRNSLKSNVLEAPGETSVWATLEDQPIVVAKQVGRGTIATFGFHPSEARDADGNTTALLKQLLIFGSPSPAEWFDLEGNVVLRMDDPGGSQNIHLKSWSYPKLTEPEWSAIGDALKAHNARLTIGYVPGWVDDGDASRGLLKVEGSEVKRTPGHIYPSPLITYQEIAGTSQGTFHDYQSEFRGIQKLRSLGLCDVELHGHTHIHPDTEAWARSEDRYQNPSWYHDLRVDSQKSSVYTPTLSSKITSFLNRKKDPLSLGLATIAEYFGVHPTTLVCPQHIISRAAQERALELDFDFINSNYLALRNEDRWCWSTHVPFADFDEPASAWFDSTLPVVAHFHDRDIAQKGVEWFAQQLDAWRAAGARKFIDFRELAGALNANLYLHLIEQADGDLILRLKKNTPALVRPVSVLIHFPVQMQPSKISAIGDDSELTLPLHMLNNEIGRVIIPCTSQSIPEKTIRSGTIRAEPNPIPVADASGAGVTTLSWESTGADLVEVHVDKPDGALLSSATPSGSFTTGKWVRDGMKFYLQDVTGGLPLFAENTLATVTAEVVSPEAFSGNLIRFIAFLAERFGCSHVIDVGCNSTNRLVASAMPLELIGVGSGRNFEESRQQSEFGAWIEWNLGRPGRIPLPEKILHRSIILCSDVTQFSNRNYLFENVHRWLQYSPACIVSNREKASALDPGEHDLQKLELELRSANLNPEFSGWTMDDVSERQALAILSGGESAPNCREAPVDFKVVAIMTAYNEEDIVVPSLQRLIDQDILIYFIDNWSTDSTYDLAKRFEGKGIIGHERFPEHETKEYNWGALLTRVEEVARRISADWFIHHDIDEVRTAPWPEINLRDGIYRVDQAGFNCVDHTVIEFHPVDNDFVAGSSFEKHFRHFEFSKQSGHFLQIKAWKNLGIPVSLAASGGHDAQFTGQKVYPYKFLLKHYPVRSQKHGEKKVFYDRKLRWNARERAAGWHSHYDSIQTGHVFLRSPSEVEIYDDDTFYKRYVLERLSGVGVNRKRQG